MKKRGNKREKQRAMCWALSPWGKSLSSFTELLKPHLYL